MLFAKSPLLPIVVCPICRGTASLGIKKCSGCAGLSVGYLSGQQTDAGQKEFLYFGYPFTRYQIAVRRARVILHRLELVGALFIAVTLLGLFVYTESHSTSLLSSPSIVDVIQSREWFLLWLSFGFFSFALVVAMRGKKNRQTIDNKLRETSLLAFAQPATLQVFDWKEVMHLSRKKKVDISLFFDEEAKQTIQEAYRLADTYGNTEVNYLHVFSALLNNSKIRGVFLRLSVPVSLVQTQLTELFAKDKKTDVMPVVSAGTYQIVFQSYQEAIQSGQDLVRITELLLAVVRSAEPLQEMLYDLEVENDKLTNVVEWVRIRERLRRQSSEFRQAAKHHNKHGIDRAMTAVATPFLNNYSQDLTLMSLYGQLPPCVAREKEIGEIFRVIEAGRQSVVLVGEHGVGKMSIIQGIVDKMIQDKVPKRLNDKRLVQLSTSALVSGTTVSGAQERLIRIAREIRRAGNIILFIDNIHDLVGGGDAEGLDVSKTLAEFMGQGDVLLFATSTPNGYNQHLLNSEIGTMLSRVEIKEMEENQAIQVLEAKAGLIEYKQDVFFSYASLQSAVAMAKRFLHDQILPESAVELITEAASFARSQRGKDQLVTANDVAGVVNEKTGVPVTSITDDESTKLLKLEDQMHERVIGQHEAVTMVANALRRARVEIRATNRPIANFLFLGPTGVGKTELAKTIAEVYFGGEDSMIRLDMSEFQDSSSVYRLIGNPGQQGTGLLTEAVRQRPFSLVLLDEMEKADPKILDLFLQVFDDGRLTDSVGRVIDFTSTIIIATSNAGTPYIQEKIRSQVPVEEIQAGLLKTELKAHFRPEFLNRFDGLIVFKPLDEEATAQIARLMIKRVGKSLEARGIELVVTDNGIAELSRVGFDPEFGARPMRRAIQDKIENVLAEMILQGKLQRRDRVVFDGQTGMKVEKSGA